MLTQEQKLKLYVNQFNKVRGATPTVNRRVVTKASVKLKDGDKKGIVIQQGRLVRR